MVTVKFFGMYSIDYGMKSTTVHRGRVSDILERLSDKYPQITVKGLKRGIMIINTVPVYGNARFSVILEDGDELAFLSPASGG